MKFNKWLMTLLCCLTAIGVHAQTLLESSPADGARMDKFEGVTLTFDQSVTTKRSWSTDINVRVGSPTGSKVSVAEWELEKNGDNSVRIYPGNNSGTLSPIDFEGGKEYYLIIPKGEIKEYASDIVLHYYGPEAGSAIALESSVPADNSNVASFDGVVLNFTQPVSVRSSWSTKITLATGSPTGQKVSVAEWELEKKGDNSVRIYPGNNSGNLAPVEMLEGTDYYLTIPAGEIKEWQEPIVLHYQGAIPVAPPLQIVSMTPADGAEMSTFDGVSIEFTGTVSVRSSWSTKITLTTGSPTGQKVSVAEWELEKRGDNTVRIYPGNNSGTLAPVELLENTDYYLTIPAGEIKEWQEPIVLHYVSPKASKEHDIMLYATLLYSDSWEKGKTRVGMYRIPVSGEGGFQPVLIDSRLSAQMGGTKTGNLYFASFGNDIGLTTLWVNTLWDTETWEPIKIDPTGSQESMASCLTTDPTTGVIYGSFADSTFGTINPETGSRTSISTLDNAWNAMACGSDGKLYAIDMEGNLLSVDKENGVTTLVGSTGLKPQYMTSAAIDPVSGRMFYALHSDDKCALYEISLENATATLMFDMPGNEWFSGIYISGPEAADEAPDMPVDAEAFWNGADLAGKVTFKAPEETYGGGKLSGQLNYTVKQGSSLLAAGSSAPGEMVTAEISVAKAGMTHLTIAVENASGVSPRAYLNVWAGADTPDAPAEVNLSENPDGGYLISWSAVTTGVNGGWVDPEAITYTVTRMPDNVAVAENIPATSFVDITNHIAGVAFHYEVTASYVGNTSRATSSGEMKVGLIIPPYSATFEDAQSASSFTIINANEDSEKWQWNSSQKAMRLSASSSRAMDDWLVTPAIELQEGMIYTFSIDAKSQSTSYPETFEVVLGAAPTVEALTENVIEAVTVKSTDYINYEAKVRVAQTGAYYFGVHGISEADTYSLYVDNIAVSEGVEGEYPNLAIGEVAAPRYVEAGQKFTVNVRVENKGTVIPSDAFVVITYGEEELGRAQVGNLASGENAIVGVTLTAQRDWKHFMTLSANIDWEEDAEANDNVSEETLMLVHIPALPSVQNLREATQDNSTMLLWDAPDLSATAGETLTEDFEGYEPFEYVHSGDWVYYDADNMPSFGFANDKIGFPGMEDPAAFFVFDISYRNEYRQQASLQSRSGDKYLASFSSKGNVATENWVISPRLSGNAQTVSFYAKAFDSSYGETFDVLVSESGMAEEDFILLKQFRNISTDWKNYSVELPEKSLFFAIRHNTVDSYMMMVDDITYIPAGTIDHNLQVAGYNVYREGEKLNGEPLSEPCFRLEGEVIPMSQYAVEVVYNKGVSEQSQLKLTGMMEIDGDLSGEVEYYNLQGVRIFNPKPGTIVIERRNDKVAKRVI